MAKLSKQEMFEKKRIARREVNVFSLKFLNTMINSGINVFVPWKSHLELQRKYDRLFKRYQREKNTRRQI